MPVVVLESSTGAEWLAEVETARAIQNEVTMWDLLYVAIAIAFFVALWAFTKVSERF